MSDKQDVYPDAQKIEQKYGMITIDFPSELCSHVERFVLVVDDYLVENRHKS